MRLKSENEVLSHLSIIRDHIDEHLKDNCSINTGLIANQLMGMCTDNTKFVVRVTKVDPKKRPFIMCVYPDVDELSERAEGLLVAINKDYNGFLSAWQSIRNWVIEIDSRIITRGNPICVDNGSQFVAILCHEIDHILYTHPIHLVYNYKMNRAKINYLQKAMSEKAVMAKLFLPMFVCIEGLRIIVRKPISQADEIRADLKVPNEYKPYMVEYTERHIIPNDFNLIATYEEFDAEQAKAVTFSHECVRLMTQRKSILKIQLEAQYKLSPNGYFKDVCKKVLTSISGLNPDTGKTDPVKESRIYKKMDAALEGLEAQVEAALESRNIEDRDIIILQADADSISSSLDKTYVINTAFDYMDILNKRRNKILSKTKETDQKKLDALTKAEDQKIAQLNNIINDVMTKKVTYYGDHYGVFVKYPEGYEG